MKKREDSGHDWKLNSPMRYDSFQSRLLCLFHQMHQLLSGVDEALEHLLDQICSQQMDWMVHILCRSLDVHKMVPSINGLPFYSQKYLIEDIEVTFEFLRSEIWVSFDFEFHSQIAWLYPKLSLSHQFQPPWYSLLDFFLHFHRVSNPATSFDLQPNRTHFDRSNKFRQSMFRQYDGHASYCDASDRWAMRRGWRNSVNWTDSSIRQQHFDFYCPGDGQLCHKPNNGYHDDHWTPIECARNWNPLQKWRFISAFQTRKWKKKKPQIKRTLKIKKRKIKFTNLATIRLVCDMQWPWISNIFDKHQRPNSMYAPHHNRSYQYRIQAHAVLVAHCQHDDLSDELSLLHQYQFWMDFLQTNHSQIPVEFHMINIECRLHRPMWMRTRDVEILMVQLMNKIENDSHVNITLDKYVEF